MTGGDTGTPLEDVCARAVTAGRSLDALGRHGRARVLLAMADALQVRRTELVRVADEETSLGQTRLGGELTRTVFQLWFLADVITDGAHLEATIDPPGATPAGPRPDLRRMLRPRGVVAVFGASNFPFAFSVPGGGVSVLATGGETSVDGVSQSPLLLAAHPDALTGPLLDECFGPGLVVSRYGGRAELESVTDRLGGALTATVHADPADGAVARVLLERFADTVGRVVWNGYPTGVAVAWAMRHGGPMPSATDAGTTSVGAGAVHRWLRPVSYQDVPSAPAGRAPGRRRRPPAAGGRTARPGRTRPARARPAHTRPGGNRTRPSRPGMRRVRRPGTGAWDGP